MCSTLGNCQAFQIHLSYRILNFESIAITKRACECVWQSVSVALRSYNHVLCAHVGNWTSIDERRIRVYGIDKESGARYMTD